MLRSAWVQPTVPTRLRYHSRFDGNFSAPDAPDRFPAPDDFEAINLLLYSRGWTDGLPVVPPTPDRLARMIEQSGFDPGESLGRIEPRQGRATVAKVAVNAIMAGCQPAHLPVVVAATRTISAADVNASHNAMGQGSLANAAIGRAIRLVLLNIGGGTPGILDRATMGTPAKFAFCFAENAAGNPWGETLHMERGFAAGQSAVTLAGVEGPHNVNDHYGRSAEEILITIGGVMATPGANNAYLGGEIIVVLGPEHAEIIDRDGLSAEDVQRFLVERAVIPGWHISEAHGQMMAKRLSDRFIGEDWRDGVRIFSAPEEVVLLVAGAAGRHSCVIPSFGNTRSVTVPILDAAGQAL